MSHSALCYASSPAAKGNKPSLFDCKYVSGGLWLEGIDNIQCFFLSLLPSGTYTVWRESGARLCRKKWYEDKRCCQKGQNQSHIHSTDILLGTHICHRLSRCQRQWANKAGSMIFSGSAQLAARVGKTAEQIIPGSVEMSAVPEVCSGTVTGL